MDILSFLPFDLTPNSISKGDIVNFSNMETQICNFLNFESI